MASVTEVNATGSSRFMSVARAVQYMLCCQARGDALGMHLGMQHVRDGEDSEDGKGGGGAEGGSRAWQLLGIVLSACPGMCACSTNGLCMHHARTMGGIKALQLM